MREGVGTWDPLPPLPSQLPVFAPREGWVAPPLFFSSAAGVRTTLRHINSAEQATPPVTGPSVVQLWALSSA